MTTTAPSRPAPTPGAGEPRVPTGAQAPGQRSPADVRITALRRFALSITVFNILGHTVLGFEQARIVPILCALVSYTAAIAFESVDAWATGRRPEYAGGWLPLMNFLLPAHIVGLASGMILYGNSSPWPYLFAVVVANASKYLVRVRVKGRLRHVFNPSNTGIAVTLALFPWVGGAPPYQFTNFTRGAIDWLLPVVVLAAGTMLNAQLTKKIPLILGWVGGFVGQAVVRAAFFGHSLVGALLPLTGVAFILFTNYMITDPGTTPVKPRRQAVFGATTALIYGALVVSGVVFGMFWALTITCALRGLVMFGGPRVAGWRAARRRPAAETGRAELPAAAHPG
jgi:enediyne biosynthesis protein E5